MVERGELTFKVIRLETGGQEVLARAGNFFSWWREPRSIPQSRCGRSRKLNCGKERESF
jgi:hypothetical protein